MLSALSTSGPKVCAQCAWGDSGRSWKTRAGSGHAAAPPRRLMNLRRRISSPKLRGQHCIGSNEHFDRAQIWHQNHCRSAQPMSLMGLVSRVTPVHTAVRNCTRDEGRPFEVGNQVPISGHRKLLSSKAMVVNVAEKSEQDFDRESVELARCRYRAWRRTPAV